MSSFEQIIVSGKLSKDADLRFTKTGKAVCTLNIPVSRYAGNKDGKPDFTTVWYKVVIWGDKAENAGSLKKGTQVFALGLLQCNEYGSPKIWNDASGKARSNFEINASIIKYDIGKDDGSSSFETLTGEVTESEDFAFDEDFDFV